MSPEEIIYELTHCSSPVYWQVLSKQWCQFRTYQAWRDESLRLGDRQAAAQWDALADKIHASAIALTARFFQMRHALLGKISPDVYAALPLNGSDLTQIDPEAAARAVSAAEAEFQRWFARRRPSEPSGHRIGVGPVQNKRRTQRGRAQEKLIAGLTQHHRYYNGSCLNLEPIGNNALARLVKVGKRTASAFFKKEFKGYAAYRRLCNDPSRLAAALKLLNGEYAPHYLCSTSTLESSKFVSRRTEDEGLDDSP